jgi:glycosyltransferase involved in cell wall biosynthesis
MATDRPLSVLLDLRPALDGHSGIPQETRLLFRGLAGMADVQAVGLLGSGNLVVEPGLPMRGGEPLPGLAATERIDRLSRVVVSLQQGPASNRIEWLKSRLLKFVGSAGAVAASLLGRRVPLGGFEAEHFSDWVWRALFAKTLPVTDRQAVLGARYRVMRWPWSILHGFGVFTAPLGYAAYARLDTRGLDVFIAETPWPARVSRGTQLVVRYHDAVPLLMPHTIKDRGYHRAAHYQALLRNARDGAWFACVSEATRRDLLSVLPGVADRAVTIPNMISHHFHALPDGEEVAPSRVPEIVWSRKNRRAPHGGGAEVADDDIEGGSLHYLLMVSTIEPRKNHLTLLEAWEQLRATDHPKLQLVIVGGLGWEHESIVSRFSPWLQRGGVHFLSEVPSSDLRVLYRHAAVTVCPSYGEGFDFSGVEAMRSGGVVAASELPVHREIYGDACEYFSPYATAELVACLQALLAPAAQARRSELVTRGAEVSSRYLPEAVMPAWHALLQRLRTQQVAS